MMRQRLRREKSAAEPLLSAPVAARLSGGFVTDPAQGFGQFGA